MGFVGIAGALLSIFILKINNIIILLLALNRSHFEVFAVSWPGKPWKIVLFFLKNLNRSFLLKERLNKNDTFSHEHRNKIHY